MKRSTHLILLVFIIIMCGCGSSSYQGIAPDDELSATVSDAAGDIFRYLGKEQRNNGAVEYEYYAPYESITVENISHFMNTVASLSVEESEHIVFSICPQIPGGSGGTCALQNYIELSEDGEKYDLEFSEMCVYTISYQDLSDPILMEPDTFTGVEGVKYLRISKLMQEKADEEGIDWYEIWPDLEGVEIF